MKTKELLGEATGLNAFRREYSKPRQDRIKSVTSGLGMLASEFLFPALYRINQDYGNLDDILETLGGSRNPRLTCLSMASFCWEIFTTSATLLVFPISLYITKNIPATLTATLVTRIALNAVTHSVFDNLSQRIPPTKNN